MKLAAILTFAASVLMVLGVSIPSAFGDGFSASLSWATFDPGENGVGADPDGFQGAAFDGRYLYFAPQQNGTAQSGEVMRYDTSAPFSSPDSWETYDFSADPLGCAQDSGCNDPTGYRGAVYDGRYVYFAPDRNGTDMHGEVLRYDTMLPFQDPASWDTYDYSTDPSGCAMDIGCNNPRGYIGAVWDGRYVYFAPNFNGIAWHAEVLRYDTTLAFDNSASWDTYDYGEDPLGCTLNPGCSDPDGYSGVVFDGRYIYFSPLNNGNGEQHGEVLRYDTAVEFNDPASWDTYDYSTDSLGCAQDPKCNDPVGFEGLVFDGHYIYFVPSLIRSTSCTHGEILRYDTTLAFDDPGSWDTYDYGEDPLGCSQELHCTNDPDGFNGATFDGRFVYFAPHGYSTGDPCTANWYGQVLRFDTSGDFSSSSSWSTYSAAENSIGTNPVGFRGAIYDGERFVYFVPNERDFPEGAVTKHGEVLRFDTLAGNPIPTVSEGGLIVMALLVLSTGTLVYARRRPAREC